MTGRREEVRVKITSLPKSWLRVFRRLSGARGIAGFDPRRGLGEFFGHFAQKLRGALLRFWRDFFFYKTLHTVEFFVNSPAKILEILDALQPCKFFIDALAELLEFVHKCQAPGKTAVQGR